MKRVTIKHLAALALLLFGFFPLFGSGLVTGASRGYQPGDKVLFQTDFRNCPVGEIPEGFDKIEGVVECVKYNDHIWVAPSNTDSFRLVRKEEVGTDDFSIEFTVVPYHYKDVKFFFDLYAEDPIKSRVKAWKRLEMYFEPMGCHISLSGVGGLRDGKACHDKPVHIAIQARRHQLRVYRNGERIASIPFKIDKPIIGFVWGRNSIFSLAPKPYDTMISDIRIAKYTKREAKPTPEQLGIRVEKTAEGSKLTVPEKVLFDFNKFILKPEAKKALDAVVRYIRTHPAKKIVVTGYTDNIGTDAYNLKLSLQRAQSVADYLIYCGKVLPGLFKIVGKGKADPIADNATDEGRAKNRRVVIRLIR